jgi:hypothetical protein
MIMFGGRVTANGGQAWHAKAGKVALRGNMRAIVGAAEATLALSRQGCQ